METTAIMDKVLRRYHAFGLISRLLFAMFAYFSVATFLFWVCSANVLLFLVFYLVNRARWRDALIFFYGIELVLFVIGCVITFGWTSGFQLHILSLCVATLLYMHIPQTQRRIMALIPLFGLVLLFPQVAEVPTVLDLPVEMQKTLLMVNIVILAAVIGYVVHFFDEVANVERLRAESLAESRARLIANLSHELKSPLAALLASIQSTAIRERSVPEYIEALRYSEKTTQYVARLSKRMLDLTEWSLSVPKPEWESVRLNALVEAVIALLQPLAQESQVTLNLVAGKVCTHRSDAFLFQTLAQNLIVNAIQHSSAESEVTIRLREHPQNYLLEVTDEGPGIEDEDLAHIYEPFYRSDTTRSRREGRHGLGLSLCKEICDQLDYRIEVISTSGQGTCFRVHMPR